MSTIDLLGYSAGLAVLAAFCMSSIVPLRIVAILSNVLFVSYGLLAHLYPVFLLHAILLPINLLKLVQADLLLRNKSPIVGEVLLSGIPLEKSACDVRLGQFGRNSLAVASSAEGIDRQASGAGHMNRRSLNYKWTQEDRVTRVRWMRGLAIFYGSISLVLFLIMAGGKPSHLAQNGPSTRSDRIADCSAMHRESCARTLQGD